MRLAGWATPYMITSKEIDDNTGLYYYGARFYDPRISVGHEVDPLANEAPRWTSYRYVHNNPIGLIDPDGRGPDDWVLGNNGNIYWDKNAVDQSTTKAGDTYLGKDLTFTFNSYIDGELWEGPLGKFPAGDKLTSTITLTSNTGADNNLLSVDISSDYEVHKTGGIFQGLDYFPGQKNVRLDIKGATNGKANFEQHTMVIGFDEFGLG